MPLHCTVKAGSRRHIITIGMLFKFCERESNDECVKRVSSDSSRCPAMMLRISAIEQNSSSFDLIKFSTFDVIHLRIALQR